MDRDAIAREIAARDLYRQRGGSQAPSDQLRLRARKPEYQHLFECSDSRCSKIRLRNAGAVAEAGRARQIARDERPASSGRLGAIGAATDDREEWYEELRQRYRPSQLRILLVGESPPDPGADERRFFYAPTLARYDNLYRGVASALYGDDSSFRVERKEEVLQRLSADGFWLIDAVEHPINKSSTSARKRAIGAEAPR